MNKLLIAFCFSLYVRSVNPGRRRPRIPEMIDGPFAVCMRS